MHIAILRLFHFYLFNISHWQSQSPLTQGWRYREARDYSYKSDILILRHSHVTALFVNNDVQRRRQDIDQKFASVERIQC